MTVHSNAECYNNMIAGRHLKFPGDYKREGIDPDKTFC